MTAIAYATGDDKNLKCLHVCYALLAASLFVGPLASIIAVIIAYVKRDDVADARLASHFRWQIRTFWFALLWAAIGVALLIAAIGVAVYLAAEIWLIYRVVKGWLYLNDGKAMYAPKLIRGSKS